MNQKTVSEIQPGDVVTATTSSGVKVLDRVPVKLVEQPSPDRDGNLDWRFVKLSGSAEHGVQPLLGGVWPASSLVNRNTVMTQDADGVWQLAL